MMANQGRLFMGEIKLSYKKNPSSPAQNYLPEYRKSLKGILKYTMVASTGLKGYTFTKID